jgi:hypothetical protein
MFGGSSLGGRMGGQDVMIKTQYAHRIGKTIIAVAMIVFRILDGVCFIPSLDEGPKY